MKITKPNENDYPAYLGAYISKLMGDDLIDALEKNFVETAQFVNGLTEEKLNFRYAAGKWSVKEILIHVMDAERIFAYRALTFARNDKNQLPGFEENDYAPASKASLRSVQSIMSEFEVLRKSTIELFKNFDEEQLNQSGIANGKRISVSALGYATAGHELHHLQVIRERYL